MSIIYIKIKIKSLAEEARMIRKEERKELKRLRHLKITPRDHITDALFMGLFNHRTWDVRRESRAANLAYAFLRGKQYKNIEHNRPLAKVNYSRCEKYAPYCVEYKLIKRAETIVEKYSKRKAEEFRNWILAVDN